MNDPVKANHDLYDTYYNKPKFWFTFRYDTQIKRKTCAYLLNKAHISKNNLFVLEIGFGSGDTLFSFNNSCSIFGTEISHSAIRNANIRASQKGYKNFRFDFAKNDKLLFQDNFFDIIIASHVLEHMEREDIFFNEIQRVLKPNGCAIILIPINEKYPDPRHFRKYSTKSFLSAVDATSFQCLNSIENIVLFVLVEKFYYLEYNRRFKFLGTVLSGLFNFPFSILPFHFLNLIDSFLIFLGLCPRQAGFLLIKKEDN